MAALRIEAAVGRIEAALVGNADDDDLESVAGKGGRFQAETSRDRGQGKGYGYYGGRRSSAWYEKKNRRAYLHQAGLQPRSTAQTLMCWHCKKHQPSKYCGHELCGICCEQGVWNGGPCQYHDMMADPSSGTTRL